MDKEMKKKNLDEIKELISKTDENQKVILRGGIKIIQGRLQGLIEYFNYIDDLLN